MDSANGRVPDSIDSSAAKSLYHPKHSQIRKGRRAQQHREDITYGERKTETEIERQRGTEREAEIERQRDKRQSETEGDRQRDRQRESETERQRDIERNRERLEKKYCSNQRQEQSVHSVARGLVVGNII